jgi:anti-anti-sigma factor
MTARVASTFEVVLRIASPELPDLPLLECLEHRRRQRTSAEPCTVLLRGELCAYTAPFLLDHLERTAAGDPLVLDLRDVSFVDSSGLAVCDEIYQRWGERHLSVRFTELRDRARFIVGVLGLDHLCAEHERAARPARSRERGGGDRQRVVPGADPTSAPESPATGVAVRNLDGGRIEIATHGPLGADGVADLRTLIDRLIAIREPGELRIDLRDSTADVELVGPLVHASQALWSIGSKLVVSDPSPELRRVLPVDPERMVIETHRA